MKNLHSVPKRQWKKWPELSQRVFNAQYALMFNAPELFMHPKMGRPYDAKTNGMWNTVAWNSAWIAADNVLLSLKKMSGE